MNSYPVLIVGGGPAGLTASLLLSRHGVESLLVERHPTLSIFPRASGLHSRAMEILRLCGLESRIREERMELDPGPEWRTRFTGPTVREMRFSPEQGAALSPCEGATIYQDSLEPILYDAARGYAEAELRFGTEVESLTQQADGVEAVVLQRATGDRSRVHARYVIAADGAASGVRRQLGIAMDGPDELSHHLQISFRADLRRWTGTPPRPLYLLEQQRAVLLPTRADNRWALNTETIDAAAPCDPAAVVRATLGIPDLELDVLAAMRWTAASQVARRYRDGSVFLVGDAAHRLPPAGGTGMNTAIHDVHNLAWKLGAVLRGVAGEGLLASYAAERMPVGRRNVEQAHRNWQRQWDPGAAGFDGLSLQQIDMGYRYGSTSPEPADYSPAAEPGCRAPHVWITTPAGQVSTIDLFGRRCTLLTGPRGDLWRAAAAQLRLPLDVHRIDEPEWAAAYGVSASGAVLVRPDGHVAWRQRRQNVCIEPPDWSLATALGAALHPAVEPPSVNERWSPTEPGARPAGPVHASR